MRDLTSGVVALRDDFAKKDCERAAAARNAPRTHERLAAYALHRREAIAGWRESPSRGRGAGAASGEAAQPRAAESRVADRAPSEPPPAPEAAPVSPEPPAFAELGRRDL